MKLFITIIFSSILISNSCFADELFPKIDGFLINLPVDVNKKVCESYEDAKWETMPDDLELPGKLYRCTATIKKTNHKIEALFHAQQNIVLAIRLASTNAKLCGYAVEIFVGYMPCKDDSGTQWEYCSPLWRINCFTYKTMGGEQRAVIDIFSTLKHVYAI